MYQEKEELNYTLLKPQYAQNFIIQFHKGYTLVQVLNQNQPIAQYVLLKRGQKKPTIKADAFLQIPVQKFATFSTTDLAAIEALKLHKALVGVPEKEYIVSKNIQNLLQEGKLKIVGGAVSVNYEQLVALRPEMVLVTTPWNKVDRSLEKLKSLQITYLLNSSYLEEHPLGRAEWIKFIAIFFDKLPQAEKIFTEIERDYANLQQIVLEQVKKKPTVLCNIPYAGTWYVPGGRSYMAKLLEDAGADYLWKEDKQTKSLALGLETVMQRGLEADFWIHFDNLPSKKALRNADKRYEKIKAFQIGNLWNNNLTKNAFSGNDFYEQGSLHPEWILADLIKIFHPTLKLHPKYLGFRFYQKLK
ncbi:MAG: ABC transporter substrate-binding protein [Microscillaceae bacterium]|nr:ABC transporter substrate-binding protein [Microscillaceae bacterium]MDW8459711.1 ABC transporter substrate-binding protein [Cytophagales bacterium]